MHHRADFRRWHFLGQDMDIRGGMVQRSIGLPGSIPSPVWRQPSLSVARSPSPQPARQHSLSDARDPPRRAVGLSGTGHRENGRGGRRIFHNESRTEGCFLHTHTKRPIPFTKNLVPAEILIHTRCSGVCGRMFGSGYGLSCSAGYWLDDRVKTAPKGIVIRFGFGGRLRQAMR